MLILPGHAHFRAETQDAIGIIIKTYTFFK
jgi:hypothetical protein